MQQPAVQRGPATATAAAARLLIDSSKLGSVTSQLPDVSLERGIAGDARRNRRNPSTKLATAAPAGKNMHRTLDSESPAAPAGHVLRW